MEGFCNGDRVVFCTLEELKERYPNGSISELGFDPRSSEMHFVNQKMIADFSGEVFTVISDKENGKNISIKKDEKYPHKNLTAFGIWSFSRNMFKRFENFNTHEIPDCFLPDFSILFS